MSKDIIKELNKPIYLRIKDNTRLTEKENLVFESIIEFIKKIDLKINIVVINEITEKDCKIDVGFICCDFPLHIGYNFADNFICYNRSDVMEGVYINEDGAIKKITDYINKWCYSKKSRRKNNKLTFDINNHTYIKIEDNTRLTNEENLVLESIIGFIRKIDPDFRGMEIDRLSEEGCSVYLGLLDFPMFLGYEFKRGIICYHIKGGDVMNLVDINKEDEAIKKITDYINNWLKSLKGVKK